MSNSRDTADMRSDRQYNGAGGSFEKRTPQFDPPNHTLTNDDKRLFGEVSKLEHKEKRCNWAKRLLTRLMDIDLVTNEHDEPRIRMISKDGTPSGMMSNLKGYMRELKIPLESQIVKVSEGKKRTAYDVPISGFAKVMAEAALHSVELRDRWGKLSKQIEAFATTGAPQKVAGGIPAIEDHDQALATLAAFSKDREEYALSAMERVRDMIQTLPENIQPLMNDYFDKVPQKSAGREMS